MDNFSSRLESLIEKWCLSQGRKHSISAFSNASNISISALRSYIKEGSEPSRPNLIKISQLVEVSLEKLITGNEDRIRETLCKEIRKIEKKAGKEIKILTNIKSVEMGDTIPKNSAILYLEGNEIKGNGIYILKNKNHLYIRRIQELANNEIMLICDSEKYVNEKITLELLRQQKIIGKIKSVIKFESAP